MEGFDDHAKLKFWSKSAFLYLKSAVLLTCKFCLYTLYYTLVNGFSKSLGQSSLPKWPQKIFELQCFCNDDLAFFKKILGWFFLSSAGRCWRQARDFTCTKVQQIFFLNEYFGNSDKSWFCPINPTFWFDCADYSNTYIYIC